MANIRIARIRPMKIVGMSRDEVIRKAVGSACYTSGGSRETSYNGYVSTPRGASTRHEGTIHLYNLHKVNPKTRIVMRKGKPVMVEGKNGRMTTKREVVQRGGWIAYVYHVPMRMVRTAKQHTRNFELVLG